MREQAIARGERGSAPWMLCLIVESSSSVPWRAVSLRPPWVRAARKRKKVPMAEIIGLEFDFLRQLGQGGDGNAEK